MAMSRSDGAPRDALSRLLGFVLLEEGPGRARVQGEVRAEHCNVHGTAHGGFVFSLADEAFAVASNSHGPQAVALVASIHFTASVGAGDTLVAEAREISLGPRTATYEVTVTSTDRMVALFTGTVYRRAAGPGP
jgi:acyl-CoA thioesterase